jgi:hypothetical protein
VVQQQQLMAKEQQLMAKEQQVGVLAGVTEAHAARKSSRSSSGATSD